MKSLSFGRVVQALEALYKSPSISKNVLEFAGEETVADSPSLIVLGSAFLELEVNVA